jgi:endonuclease/exonuclease/phosphatase family metal-dependent hydrolase
LVYASVLISPGHFWLAGFLSMLIPLFLVINLVMILVLIRRLNKIFFYHLAALLIGFPFMLVTFSIHKQGQTDQSLKILSYNVRVFNNYAHLRNKNFESSKKMIEWSVNDDSDIKCFQEFYNKDNSELFNVVNRMKAAGWKYVNYKQVLVDRSNADFGIVIFSKYPMVYKGALYDDKGVFKKTIFADVLYHGDTVRIYNVHLKSMSIDVDNVTDAEKLSRSYKKTGQQLREGFIYRSEEVDLLTRHIAKSPHPVILCGDLNDMPYSYSYFQLRRVLNNSFEQAGNGFGFTYNGKLFFLRIDNQFFSPSVAIQGFDTYRKVKYSDHFPVKGMYSID